MQQALGRGPSLRTDPHGYHESAGNAEAWFRQTCVLPRARPQVSGLRTGVVMPDFPPLQGDWRSHRTSR